MQSNIIKKKANRYLINLKKNMDETMPKTIVPVPKTLPATSPNNFKPTFLLCVLSKVLEKHVYALVASRIDEKHLFNNCSPPFYN